MDLLPHFNGYSLFIASLFFFTALLSIITYVPQAIRCLRFRDVHGLAPAALSMGLANYMLWNIYYIGESAFSLLWLSIAATVPYIFMLLTARRAGLTYWPAGKRALIYFFLTCSLFFLWPPAIGIVILFGGAYYFIDSFIVAYKSPTVTGLSASSWTMLFLDGLTYLLLGLTVAPWATFVYGLIACPISIAILVLIALKPKAVEI